MLLYPRATYRPVVNCSGAMTDHLGLILHVQAGDGSPWGWFNDPASSASSTFWIGKTGTVEQYVDADLKAWAQAAGNATYNSVETEGQPSDPLTSAQVEQLAQLYAWGVAHYRWPLMLAEQPGQPGLGWHGMGGTAWGGHFGCPGDLRKAQRADVLARARQLLTPPAPTPSRGKKMLYIVHATGGGTQWLTDGITKRKLINSADLQFWSSQGAKSEEWPPERVNAIPTVGAA